MKWINYSCLIFFSLICVCMAVFFFFFAVGEKRGDLVWFIQKLSAEDCFVVLFLLVAGLRRHAGDAYPTAALYRSPAKPVKAPLLYRSPDPYHQSFSFFLFSFFFFCYASMGFSPKWFDLILCLDFKFNYCDLIDCL